MTARGLPSVNSQQLQGLSQARFFAFELYTVYKSDPSRFSQVLRG
jgi:hypothetical protein